MGSELFSLNEFADTWMAGITFGLMCVFVVGWLFLAVRLTALWKLPRFAAGRAGSTSHYALVLTELERAGRLAVVELGSDRGWGSSPTVLGSRGNIVWVSSKDGVIAVDVRDGTVVGRESEVTAELGPHRSEGFDVQTGTLSVLLQDGRRLEVPVGAPPTTNEGALEPAEFFCRTQVGRGGQPNVSEGNLLRAQDVGRGGVPCTFAEDDRPPVRLVLHRSTAFDEGAWLLSALEDQTTLWTHDLTERLGAGELEVLLVESTSEGVVRVLVGRTTTIYSLELELATGGLERAMALY
jgi:hypothetical protein